jgi:hypothetical protein
LHSPSHRKLTPNLKPAHRPPREEGEKVVPEQPLVKGTTNRDRILARLKDKNSELFSQVANNEISAAEGARRAGISKRKRRAEVYPEDIHHTARVLLKHFDSERLYEAMKVSSL